MASQQYDHIVNEGLMELATEYGFAAPVTVRDVDETRRSSVPEKTQKLPFVDAEEERYKLRGEFCYMSDDDLKFWLCKCFA